MQLAVRVQYDDSTTCMGTMAEYSIFHMHMSMYHSGLALDRSIDTQETFQFPLSACTTPQPLVEVELSCYGYACRGF